MRIGLVTAWFERGAAYVSRQYRDLLSEHHEVFVFARGQGLTGKGDPRWDDPLVTWAVKPHLGQETEIDRGQFHRWVQSSQLDVVIFNEQRWWLPVLWCREWGLKTGAYVDYYTERTSPFFDAYDFLICHTRRHQEAFDWHDQAFYLPWGTDIDLFRPQKRSPVEPRATTFFHSVGFSPERKGTDTLLEAFSSLPETSKLVIHTQIDLKAALPGHAALIEHLGLQGRLRIVGKTVSAPGLYHLGDVYVYPTRLEGIGLTIAEALACGLPTIVPDHPPMNEFVDSDSCTRVPIDRLYARPDGYYWPQCRVPVDSLRAAMMRYVDDKERLSELSDLARRHAEISLNWSANAAPLSDVVVKARHRTPLHSDVIDTITSFELGRGGRAVRLYLQDPRLFRIYKQWRRVPALAGKLIRTLRGKGAL